ncbi:MAG: PASTA domain-containing protein [Candidatus Eisenbacteria sp.]|nr:PASTA domain-containing protein [Candidatus Eisenbacteria bacterium]
MMRASTVGRILLRLLLVGLGMVGAVMLFHFVVMPSFVRHRQETQVPDVRGLACEDVRGLLAAPGLELGAITRAVDEHIPVGRILRQSPPPGSRVKKGRHVDVVVSLGPAALDVPELEGESLVHARFLLAREGIERGRVCWVSSATVPRKRVVAASPPPGTPLAGRGTVDLLVSEGVPERRYLMPDLRGMEASSVAEALEAMGLRVHRQVWPGARARTNQVAEQTPPPGYPISAGGTVEIRTGG